MSVPNHYPHYPQQPGPSQRPPIDPKTLRPRRRWLAVGIGTIVLGLVLGVAGFGISMYRGLSLPDFAAEVTGTNSDTFTVDSEFGDVGLYTSPQGAAEDCSLVDPDGQEREFDWSSFNHTVEIGNESWSLEGTLEPDSTGEYTLECDGPENARYSVGDIGDGDREFMGTILGGLASIFGLPLLGFAIGLPIVIVTATRRNRHKRQLLAERPW